MEKRKLYPSEIEYIINFIKPNPYIHPETALSVLNINKEKLRKQLRNVEIYPAVIDGLKTIIKKQYEDSLISPGQNVGIICAQSIGEKNTQNTLNSFHKAGQSEKSVLASVPRFQEILNTTKEPKAKSCKIFFEKETDTISKLRELVGSKFVEITFSKLYTDYTINNFKEYSKWYEFYDLIYSKESWYKDYKQDKFTCFISFKLNTDIIYKYQILYEDIVKKLHSIFDDEIACVFSPENIGILDVYVNTEDISLPKDRIEFIDTENCNIIYMEECVFTELNNKIIFGVKGIEAIYYTYTDDNEWYIDTDGSNFVEIMNIRNVDKIRTRTNNMWEIYEVLGIEAVREFLIQECIDIMESVNLCHVKLLVERMTFSGNIASISRYTMRQDEAGPMSKASFEESTDNFLRAAYECDLENTDGVSASIICGKLAKNGTGISSLELDIENFF